MKHRARLGAACAALILASPVLAQSYRVRLDARAQSVWFRGLEADSILATDVVPSSNGGFETPDGRVVRCGAGAYCYFFTPGPELHGIPVSTTASITAWGLGTQGLSLRATGRLIGDLGSEEVWPATEPAAQLIEGLLEYQRGPVIARGGRQLVASRLESIGFDGGWLKYRWNRLSLEFTGYGGWGLGQAAAVAPGSPALNPLDEFRPRDRQIVAGLEAAWFHGDLDMRAEYRREIDPEDDHFVSERAALSVATQVSWIRVNGGVDYNIAEGNVGNADLLLTYLKPRYSVSAGARRYRPYFSLWTLWGAFSPVPYNAVNVSAETKLTSRISLNGRAERYKYDDAGVSTALVPKLEDRGWRLRAGARATLSDQWAVDGSYEVERGPGAAARSGDLAVGFNPGERLSVSVYGGALSRPLELRYYDATSRWIGGRAHLELNNQRRLWADIAAVSDDRDRPDADVGSLDQLRMRAGVTITFGSGADRTPLPPARPRR